MPIDTKTTQNPAETNINHIAYPGNHMPGELDPFTNTGAAAQLLARNNMDNRRRSTRNPPVHAGAGGAADPAVATCVCACCECAGGCVCYARDASDALLTNLPLRPVVARHGFSWPVCVALCPCIRLCEDFIDLLI